MQSSFHCLHQESLWQCSKITKRCRHCEAPAIPLPEQQPKPYWESSGGDGLTVVGKEGELCSPTLSHKISVSLPGVCAAKYRHYYNHQTVRFCLRVLPTFSAQDRQTRGKKHECTAKSKIGILWVETASFSNVSSTVSIKIPSHYNCAILFKHQQHI